MGGLALTAKPLREKLSSQQALTLNLVIIISLVLILVTRFLPYVFTSVPLGYDPGIYKFVMESYRDIMPLISSGALASWIKSWTPSGLFILTDVFYLFGFGTDFLLKETFIFLELLLGLMVYVVGKEYSNRWGGALSLFIYAISLVHFKT